MSVPASSRHVAVRSFPAARCDHHRRTLAEVPGSTPVSDRLSKDLAKRGFRFVGTTIVYAYMQAVGLVNDHTTDCFRWREVQGGSD